MYCINCGFKCDDNSNFCCACGSPIIKNAQEEALPPVSEAENWEKSLNVAFNNKLFVCFRILMFISSFFTLNILGLIVSLSCDDISGFAKHGELTFDKLNSFSKKTDICHSIATALTLLFFIFISLIIPEFSTTYSEPSEYDIASRFVIGFAKAVSHLFIIIFSYFFFANSSVMLLFGKLHKLSFLVNASPSRQPVLCKKYKKSVLGCVFFPIFYATVIIFYVIFSLNLFDTVYAIHFIFFLIICALNISAHIVLRQFFKKSLLPFLNQYHSALQNEQL